MNGPKVNRIGKRGQELKLHREFIMGAILRTARGEKFIFAPGVKIRFANGCTREDKDFISKLLTTRRSK